MTISDYIKRYNLLLSLDIENPLTLSLDLISHALKLDKVSILTNVNYVLTKSEVKILNNVYNRLKESEPIAYIIGNISFYKEQYKLSKDVLIPRPETELMVKVFIDSLDYRSRKPLQALEIGTGSGCISISTLNNLPNPKNLHITALDSSVSALKIANNNAKKILNTNVQKYINFVKYDFHKYKSTAIYNYIVSNPPYISLSELKLLSTSLKYEPDEALTDFGDGLIFYRSIAKFSTTNLSNSGIIILEIHEEKYLEVIKIFEESFGKNLTHEIFYDLFNKPRVIKFTLPV